ncbi:pimeloyl-ACP methyl ester esterase BioH [Wenzhouxiangella marina]|uniref:Pimelyl-ACP methyl ester esterase n=1 Tax=Wenzhouxiangella marina TaxID=1579979 RepID=A0A0K0XZW7_9GAMM|nr:pimeloyl-ACP methyl ester esterase BioH [Wenzhouxiangella marina]AKS43181.1 pimelyl-ACP methyl ester esterase [Wenzhouxiangella marina]MBB6087134.1 pimeloyl-[acyl-carrier protein] methyl ester esterase [Wenzhouxiangella marina]
MAQHPLIVDEFGHGQKLSLVHGWAMHSGLFERLIGHLDGLEVQCIDLPGHGRNQDLAWPESGQVLAEQLAQAADHGWLAGWSLGGLLALKAALARPGQLKGLILIAATPCFGQRPHWPHGVAPALVGQLAHELEVGPEQVLNRFLALEVHGSEHAAADLKLLRKVAFRYGLPRDSALHAGLNMLKANDLSEQLGELDLPVLLIGGRRDKLVSFEALEATHERLPNSRLVRIPGAAHAPFLTDAEAVAHAITDFIEEHET